MVDHAGHDATDLKTSYVMKKLRSVGRNIQHGSEERSKAPWHDGQTRMQFTAILSEKGKRFVSIQYWAWCLFSRLDESVV